MRGHSVLEHLWLVVHFVVFNWSVTTVAARASWASVVATWAAVASAVVTARTTLAVITAWTTVSAWLALWLYIALWLLEESLA